MTHSTSHGRGRPCSLCIYIRDVQEYLQSLQENSVFSSAEIIFVGFLKTDERTTTSVGQRWPTDKIVIFVGFR
jgi:hypothetical protein